MYSRTLPSPRLRLIQEEGEAEDYFASCRMGPAVRALPHGLCIPRPCCAHALLSMPCPHALLIQMESEAGTKAIGMVSLYVCIPVHFSAFFFKKHFHSNIILLFIIYCKTKYLQRGNEMCFMPLCLKVGTFQHIW